MDLQLTQSEDSLVITLFGNTYCKINSHLLVFLFVVVFCSHSFVRTHGNVRCICDIIGFLLIFPRQPYPFLYDAECLEVVEFLECTELLHLAIFIKLQF